MLTLEFDDGEVFQWSKVLWPNYLQSVKYVKSSDWKYAITGDHFHLQSHIGQTVLWSLWHYAHSRQPWIFM
jgi:hypothetical protein